MNQVNIGKLCCFIVFLGVSLSGVAQTDDARAIMERVDEQQRKVADLNLSLSTLSSCPFQIKSKKVSCTESKRVKRFESYSIQSGTNNKDSKGISVILEPAREKGVGMLTYSYEDDAKDTESWLYLSALGKVKRMVSGSAEDQEPVAFFGSEFTTEDMESGKTDEYNYKIIQKGKYGKSQVWVIEAMPLPKRLRKTNYSKLLIWVDQEKFTPLKIQGYDKHGKLYKRTIFKKLEQTSGLWIAREVTVFNLREKRLSVIDTEQIVLGVELDEAFLTQRSLSDFAFREQNLSKLRKYFK
jgi:outer membrane lipoprotein-sorting protein